MVRDRDKPKGKTLWEMLLEKFEGPLELKYYNPLKAKIGTFITFDEIDYQDVQFRVQEIVEYKRKIGRQEFLSVDYQLLGRPLGKDDIEARLRLVPVEYPDRSGGQTHTALLLHLDDEMDYSEDFHGVVTSDTGEFEVHEEGGETTTFYRINDLRQPYHARVTVLRDLDGDQKAERNEVDQRELDYWDYYRQLPGEGPPRLEFLFVEMDRETGWFQIWRGGEIDLQRAFVT